MISSVDDLRCTLNFVAPKNEAQRITDIKRLQTDLDEENAYKYRRTTVIKMLEAKIRSLQKMKF